MTIAKGEPWGRSVERPVDLRIVTTDAAATASLTDGTALPVALSGGDLHRTVGGRDPAALDQLLELPIDLLHVTLDDQPSRCACAHVAMQLPVLRGGWWRGDVVMVMNAEFIGEWHIVARGHPNDGRAEVCAWTSDLGLRQRWGARRRMTSNSHVPHPQIETRSITARTWEFATPMCITVDGEPAGKAQRVEVSVQADAAVIYT